jgi:SAM-dependent methyltransferase
MPDLKFEHPRLVSIYDAFDGQRPDLLHYLSIAKELRAKSVVDIGSGTGCLACLLAKNGFAVTGVEPARESLNYAKSKPYSQSINWVEGDAGNLGELNADLALMTGNVAQVFLTDDSWFETLSSIRRSLRAKGHLVFEVRDPSKMVWLEWTKEKTFRVVDVPGIGIVEAWCALGDVSGQLVSFRWTYRFLSDGQTLISDSTLRFRSKSEIEASLVATGYSVTEVRDAPDRPSMEFVFVAEVLDKK